MSERAQGPDVGYKGCSGRQLPSASAINDSLRNSPTAQTLASHAIVELQTKENTSKQAQSLGIRCKCCSCIQVPFAPANSASPVHGTLAGEASNSIWLL